MRPERLTISAFGPYPGEERLDFSKLGGHSLFLICGPTGAGKSTILDAICYGLYGKTSGSVRSGEAMRSNYVGLDRETYVEFDFASGNKHYRVHRMPTQLLERQKGDKSKPVEKKSKAELYEIDENGKELRMITAKGVDQEVEKILGVGAEQFRQIILLPQGDFRKLLLADSSDRQRIMQQLFRTKTYLAFEKKLQDETKKLENDYEQGKRTRETLLETCHVTSEEELHEKAEGNKKQLAEKEKVMQRLSEKQESFQKKYDEAHMLFSAFERLEKAAARLKELDGEKEKVAECRHKVKMIKSSQLVTEEWAEAESTRKQWKQTESSLQSVMKGLPQKEKAKEDAAKERDALKKQEPEQKKRLETKGKLEQYRGPAASYGAAVSDADKYKKIYEDVVKTESELQKKAEISEKKAEQERKNWLCRNEIFLHGQAFVLAEQLETGKPCPVCGATEHPHPATAGADRVTEEDVRSAEKLMQKAETASKEDKQKAEEYRAKNVTIAKENRDKAVTVLGELEKNLPREYRNLEILEKEIEKISRDTEAFDRALESAEKKHKEADLLFQNEIKQKEILAEQEKQLRVKSEEQIAQLRIKVEQAGFESLNQCNDYRNEQKMLAGYEDSLRRYDQAVHAEQEKIKDETALTKDKEKPDMKTWEDERLALLGEIKRAATEKAAQETEWKQQKETLEKLETLAKKEAETGKKYQLVSHLWDIARGKDTGINLERFVLGALLDAVTEKANLRLTEMSSRRYELLRKRGERADARKTAGLDLEVFDANTGRARPAATLSGGETFLASLSLALGLADVVREYAGGIHLDAMFIDEGFGTLDSESLDLAMKTLQQMKGENRLVGLISHVGGLEERIPAKLRVKKTLTGSTATFEIG